MFVCTEYPDHSFYELAPLDKRELLDELRNKHLAFQSTQQVPPATGMVPHIDHAVVLKNLSDLCTQINLKVNNYNESLCGSFFDTIDQKVEAEGGVNSIILLKALNEPKEQLFCLITAFGKSGRTPSPCNTRTLLVTKSDVQNAGPFQVHYKSISWCISESFTFPQNMTTLDG